MRYAEVIEAEEGKAAEGPEEEVEDDDEEGRAPSDSTAGMSQGLGFNGGDGEEAEEEVFFMEEGLGFEDGPAAEFTSARFLVGLLALERELNETTPTPFLSGIVPTLPSSPISPSPTSPLSPMPLLSPTPTPTPSPPLSTSGLQPPPPPPAPPPPPDRDPTGLRNGLLLFEPGLRSSKLRKLA